MNRLTRPLWVVLALLFLLEAWLWDHLRPIVARIVSVIPWGWVKPALVRLVDRLSPQATLVVFVVPFIFCCRSSSSSSGSWRIANGSPPS